MTQPFLLGSVRLTEHMNVCTHTTTRPERVQLTPFCAARPYIHVLAQRNEPRTHTPHPSPPLLSLSLTIATPFTANDDRLEDGLPLTIATPFTANDDRLKDGLTHASTPFTATDDRLEDGLNQTLHSFHCH